MLWRQLKWCVEERNAEKRTTWWSKEVKMAVKSKEAYRRWAQVQSADARKSIRTSEGKKGRKLVGVYREISSTIRGHLGQR